MTRNPFRWLRCIILLVLALIFAEKVRGEVVIHDSLSRNGGEMRGPIKSIKQPGTDQSFVRLYSFSPDLDPDDVITNETLRVLRIWNDHGKPRIDLRSQGASGLTVRVRSDGVETRMLVLQPVSSPPTPVAGGLYRSSSGAFYICLSVATGWELLN